MVDKRAFICSQTSDEKPILQEFPFASIAMATISNSGHGPNNEDAAGVFTFADRSGVSIVADGAGGLPAGAAASQQMINAIQQAARSFKKNNNKTAREVVIDSIFKANRRILNKKNGSGSTVAIVLFENNKVQPIYVGDSVIIITGQRGRIKYINFPHSPIGFLYRGGIGVSNPKQLAQFSHVVSNLLGTQEMFIELGSPFPLSKNDTVLVCSDGLSDIVETRNIVDLIRTGTLEQAANKLFNKINELITTKFLEHDDITFCLLRRNNQ